MAKKKKHNEMVVDVTGMVFSISLSLLIMELIFWAIWPQFSPTIATDTQTAQMFSLITMLLFIIVPLSVTYFVFRALKAKKFIDSGRRNLKKSLLTLLAAFLITQGILIFASGAISALVCQTNLDGGVCVSQDYGVSMFLATNLIQPPIAESLPNMLPFVGFVLGIFVSYYYNHKLVPKKK